LLIVSSLLCGDPNVSSLPREMLVSYLQGHFTDDAAKVARVFLAGSGPSHQDPLSGIKELDGFCLQLGRIGIPLDVMPSKQDPTTVNWPQRPLHSSLLPHATNSLSRTPNPYAAGHGNQFVVGTDGVNVRDLQRFVLTADKEPLSEIEALERTLKWGHLCPTGPSSVPTVPHVGADPMLLDRRPHIYVCGDSSEFATKTVNGTTLICVPKFSETGEAVLVNLETKDVQLLRFEDNED
jgi:DNA polymerase delta subunit 2